MKKKIIILTISMGNDGAGRVLSELSEEWVKKGHAVTVVQTGAENYGVNYDFAPGINIVNIHATSKIKPIRYAQEIKRVIPVLRQDPDATVVAFIVASIFICGVASLFVKNRIVVSERNNPRKCPPGRLQQKLRDWAFCRADRCVFQTEYAMSLFPRRAREKCVIIPNPINAHLPEPYTAERRKAIVAACRLHPQKNLPMLLRAFAMFHESYPEYQLEIYGQGAEREKLEELSAELGIEKYVKMPGFVSDIHAKMRDAAMYVSSSDYEGISNSMLEALGMGIPTVVTDCPVGGARMVIENNVNGILVPVGDEKAFCAAMSRIAGDEDFARSLSVEAVKIKEKYKLETIADNWLENI